MLSENFIGEIFFWKLIRWNFFGWKFLGEFFERNFFGWKFFWCKLFFVANFFSVKFFWVKNFWVNFFWRWKFLGRILLSENFIGIYPSQRQNLLLTLEILIQNFENFKNFKILEKNSQIQNFFPKFPKPQRGRYWHQRGRRPITSKFQNFYFLPRIAIARGI